MSPDNLMYTQCSHIIRAAQLGLPELRCLNEGWLFCTLCHQYFCDDHTCQHLAAQVARDAVREVSADSPGQIQDITPLDSESRSFFRELSEAQLLDKAEIELRSYFKRLLQEAKRIQREIERRMIYATELTGGPAYRRQRQLSQDAIDAARSKAKSKQDLTPLGLLEREEKERRARERQQKKQATIQASIALLAAQIKLGNISIDQIKLKGGKK